MARVSEEEIGALKREISVERLAEARGVALKKHGADLLGLCPFHDDREPSLVVTPEKNLWHCLGACQAGGSVIDWVMRAEGLSFRHAVEVLRKDASCLAAEPKKKRKRALKFGTTPKLSVLGERSADNDALLSEVVEYYHRGLLESPEALGYLEKRGLRDEEAIGHFRLGFANRTLGYRLPGKNRNRGAELRGRLMEIGIYRQSGHEHFNGSVVIPVFGSGGRVVEMYGRKVTPNLRRGTPKHLYLPGPHRGVWNLSGVRGAGEVILCESLIDALTFWCAGYRNVTTAYGIEGFTAEMSAALVAEGVERVLIAYDRDDAGDRAAERLSGELCELGIGSARVLFPRGMDANEYALKVTPAAKSLGVALRQAVWLRAGKKAAAPAAQAESGAEKPNARSEAIDQSAEGRREAERKATKSAKPKAAEVSAKVSSLVAEAAEAEPVKAEPSVGVSSLAAKAAKEEEPGKQSPPAKQIKAEEVGEDLMYRFGDRRWRVRGLEKNTGPEQLRVNLHVRRQGGAFHVDTLELYSSRQRGVFTKQASLELGLEERVVKRELGQILLGLEERQEEKRKSEASEKKAVELSDTEKREALALLKEPRLLERILSDFEKCGVVGEESNKLIGYLAATSRKLDEPLAVIIQSSSAAGKSSLMEAVLSLMPEEERSEYSAMTGQSLFYMGEMELSHKILAVVEEEGAERASYALKLLQSEGELSIASTGKDPATGRLVTQEYRVEGPVMIFLTTTAIEVDEELMNRCLVLTVDEGREQTRAIHALQRRAQTLEGLLERQERGRLRQLHQNAQRLLRPLFVVNPYAEELGFLDHQTRTRRDHMKYLGLIKSIALLHQYQRRVKEVEHRGGRLRYIEVARQDIEVANRLAHEVLGRSLDALPPQTRRLLGMIEELVSGEAKRLGLDRCDYRFSRRAVREHTGWSYEQVRVHMGRLVELEYLLVHRGGRGQSFLYELVYNGEGKNGERFVSGLLMPKAAKSAGTTATLGGQEQSLGGPNGDFGGPLGAHTGAKPGGAAEGETAVLEGKTKAKAVLSMAKATARTSGSKDRARRSRGGESVAAKSAAQVGG